MASYGRRRRRLTRIAAGTCKGDGELPTSTTSIQDLPDDLLELVLLRVVCTPVCLFRLATTCKLWRRVIAGDGFLERVRSLNLPYHLLGHYLVNTFWEPAAGFNRTIVEFVPFPARPAVDLRQRLSLDDFVIDGEHRLSSSTLTDSRGGLLAFVSDDNLYAIVCDSWIRQYRQLHFPWGRPVGNPGDRYCCLGVFILDDANDQGDKKSSLLSTFSVLCACLITDEMYKTTRAEACVFSAKDNDWIRWTVSSEDYTVVTDIDKHQRFLGRAGGSIFFCIGIDFGLLVLDEATGNFSTISFPLMPDFSYLYLDDRENLRVVNGGGGTLVRIIRLVDNDLKVLEVTKARHGGWEFMVGASADLCQLANIEFSAHRSWRFLDTTTAVAAATGLVLGAFSRSSTLLFSLNVETMKMKLQLANKNTTTLNVKRVFPYELPWPQTIDRCRPVM